MDVKSSSRPNESQKLRLRTGFRRKDAIKKAIKLFNIIMKKQITIVALCLTGFLGVKAQEERGVKFEKNLSWQQIKAKAKAENKNIFIDCFATWCGPCTAMKKSVFPNEKLGEYMNAHFVSVEVQMDSSASDDEQVKQWYTDAKAILQQYKIYAFPTFLFFSPEGKIIHRDLGFRKADEFIALATNLCDPQKQYYTLIENYKLGKKNYSVMKYLARTAKSLGEKDMANTIADDYLNNYLFKLKDSDLFKYDNIDFIASFIRSSKGKSFNLFYYHAAKIDKIMQTKGYAQSWVDYIIAKEDIDSKLWNADYSESI